VQTAEWSLRGLRERLEVFHGVKIADSALVTAVTLSHRYISDRFLPDKAIDLVDEACAMIRTEIDSMPAELDELTGSFNRRCIMRMLDDEIARAIRLKTPCAIALIDLDWFKRINDAFGHPTGDEVLRAFAITMFANIRSIDRFGRYGGEEFLLVLPDTPDDEAVRTLNRLRAIVADLDWSAFSPGMQVTISAGVTTLKPDETPDTFLARADSALYIAKARGRNRIVSV